MTALTLESIRLAHSRVKTGADFPTYVRELLGLGLRSYTYSVTDGRTSYLGRDSTVLAWPARYEPFAIAQHGDAALLAEKLARHQAGKSTFLEFCREAAEAGVETWAIDAEGMTCIYYDRHGREMLREDIPE